MAGDMSEPDSTGYQDSPDTTDPQSGAGAPDAGGPDAGGSDAALTTDDDAQKDDGVVRPGNEPD
jgi:hypothetical protein